MIKQIGTGVFGVEIGGTNCQSYTQQHSVTEYTCQDELGETVGVALCDDVTETTVEYVAPVSAQIPAIGDVGEYGIVTATSFNASNTAFQTYEVTYKKWSGISI